MQEFLAKSQNGITVMVDLVGSHAATHLADTPQLKDLVKEVIGQTDIRGETMGFDVDMGRIVGMSDGVETDETDEMVWAKRKNRDVYTPFTKSRAPVPCSQVAISLKRQADGTYELMSAWIGQFESPPFPGSPDETPESKPYWMRHALVWGTQEVQPGTETSTCPW